MNYGRPTPRQANAPDKMTIAYNRTIAFAKIDIARIEKLDAAMLESISRAHKVPVAELQARLAERQARHG